VQRSATQRHATCDAIQEFHTIRAASGGTAVAAHNALPFLRSRRFDVERALQKVPPPLLLPRSAREATRF
jgi:hypothetical protein